MNFENSKVLGGVGGILMFIGIMVIPYTFGLLELIGAILVLIAAKGFSDYYREAGIFNDTLYAIIMTVVGIVAFAVIAFLALIDFTSNLGISFVASNASDWASQLSSINLANVSMSVLTKFLGYVFLDLVVLFVFMVITSIMARKALKLLSEKTGVNLFRSTGTVLLVGAALVIVFGLGMILIWISTLMLTLAFFQTKSPPLPATSVQQPVQSNVATLQTQ